MCLKLHALRSLERITAASQPPMPDIPCLSILNELTGTKMHAKHGSGYGYSGVRADRHGHHRRRCTGDHRPAAQQRVLWPPTRAARIVGDMVVHRETAAQPPNAFTDHYHFQPNYCSIPLRTCSSTRHPLSLSAIHPQLPSMGVGTTARPPRLRGAGTLVPVPVRVCPHRSGRGCPSGCPRPNARTDGWPSRWPTPGYLSLNSAGPDPPRKPPPRPGRRR